MQSWFQMHDQLAYTAWQCNLMLKQQQAVAGPESAFSVPY